MRLLLPFALLAVVACAPGVRDVVVAPSVARTVVPVVAPPTPPAQRAATTFTIHEGPLLDDVFPTKGEVLDDGRVLVASGATESYGTALAILGADLGAWRIVGTGERPDWVSPLGTVAIGRRFVLVPQAYIGPNPSHRGGLLWSVPDEKWAETGLLDPSAPDSVSGATATILRDGRVLVAAGVVASSHGPPRVATRIWSKDTGRFEAAGDLVTARLEHTATVLHDGRLLVVGGKDGLGRARSVVSAELFDPATGKWTPAGDLGTARQGHTATLLPDGRVLVAGGNKYWAPAPELEAWDPKAMTWSVVGRMSEPRTHHTATLLADGRVLFIGGTVVAIDDLGNGSAYTRLTNGEAAITAETWDPSTGQAQDLLHPPSGRYDHITVLLPDGRLLVIGGTVGNLAKKPQRMEIWEPSATSDKRGVDVGPVEKLRGPVVPTAGGRIFAPAAGAIWDPDAGTVLRVSTPSFRAEGALLAPLGGGEILATDGEHAARFAGGQWKDVPAPKRHYHGMHALNRNDQDATATPLDADRVLFVGGTEGPNGIGADVWSRVDERFSDAGHPVRPRMRHTATLLEDGRVLLTGGQGEPPAVARSGMPSPTTMARGPLLRECELWDPRKKAFAATGAMGVARLNHAAVRLVDGRVLVIGGRTMDAAMASVEAWSPRTSSWTALAPMKVARASPTATLLPGGRVLVLGGDLESGTSTAEIYDPATNRWTTAGPLPELWMGHHAFPLQDGRVLVGMDRRSLVVSLATP